VSRKEQEIEKYHCHSIHIVNKDETSKEGVNPKKTIYRLIGKTFPKSETNIGVVRLESSEYDEYKNGIESPEWTTLGKIESKSGMTIHEKC
jgi:hypothetical protein